MDDKQTTTNTSQENGSPITLGQFNAFLAARAPEKPCSECGTTDWGIPGEDRAVFKGFIANGAARRGREFYPVTCRNCGFAKLYAAEVVEHWVGSNHNG
jgi:predicted nucleic-acid-binding Zn-ribbon protein